MFEVHSDHPGARYASAMILILVIIGLWEIAGAATQRSWRIALPNAGEVS